MLSIMPPRLCRRIGIMSTSHYKMTLRGKKTMRIKILIWGLTYLLLSVFSVAQTEKRVPAEYPTIQEAIDASSDGDVILVAPGTYAEGISFYGKSIVVQSEDGPLVTFLKPRNWNGMISGPIVWFHDRETAATKLIGFTLKDSLCCIAGPVLRFDFACHPTIENCIITDNPGGIYYYYSGAVLKNCLIFGNSTNLLFKFDATHFSPEIINCTIANNGAFSSLPHPDHPAPKFKNCIIYGNETDGISGNFDISYSLVEGGFIGTGNIDGDPLFVAAWNGDYHLQANSPAIDIGTAFGVPYSDIEGMTRPKGAGHDMGAYEAYLPIVLIPYAPDPTNDNTPTLDWWDVVGASTYTLQYSGRSDFNTYTEIANITESTYEITDALSDGVWYWRVRAVDSEGIAGWWTALDYFVVETPPTYTLKIAANIGGTTNPTPGSYTYDEGTKVSVIAIPDNGYEFSWWSEMVFVGEISNPISITMNSDKSITANFKAIPPTEEPKKKGGCFVATAAYGSPLHPHIDILREFRDEHLMTNKFGRGLVKLYYKYSPFVANLITKHKILKVAVRISLLPFVAFSYSMLHFGLIITTVMLVLVPVFPIFLILFFWRRMRRLEAKALRPRFPEVEKDS